jgi:hypothetical protein
LNSPPKIPRPWQELPWHEYPWQDDPWHEYPWQDDPWHELPQHPWQEPWHDPRLNSPPKNPAFPPQHPWQDEPWHEYPVHPWQELPQHPPPLPHAGTSPPVAIAAINTTLYISLLPLSPFTPDHVMRLITATRT